MPQYIFMCPDCRKICEEPEIVADKSGRIICPFCKDIPLVGYNRDTMGEGNRIVLSLVNGEDKTLFSKEWVCSPYAPINENTFIRIESYIAKMKLLDLQAL